MNHRLLSIVLLSCAGLFVSAQTLPYQNPSLSAKERAKDLCSRLTLEEKAKLMLDESPAIPRLGKNSFGGARLLMVLLIWEMSPYFQNR